MVRQKENGFPFTIVGTNSILVNTALGKENLPKLEFRDRLGYTAQLLISKKVSSKLSLELAPTFFHDNFVAYDEQHNSQYAIGFGGRQKLGKRWSINVDYGWHLNRAENSPFKNPLSIGFDLETGWLNKYIFVNRNYGAFYCLGHYGNNFTSFIKIIFY